MNYFFLVAAMASSALLSVMSSLFGRQNRDVMHTSSLYSLIVTAAATLSFGVLFLWNPSFDARVLLYSLLYGIFYTVAMLGMFGAYRIGSTSLTAFVKQLSLVAVAFWGLAFWDNPLSLSVTVGLILIIVALFFCFAPSKGKKEEYTVSLKWLLFAAMLLVGNAGCSIVQKYQQIAFDGKHGNLLMLFGVFFSFLVCFVLFLFGKRPRLTEVKKISFLCPVFGGIGSALLNLFILLLMQSTLSESVIFPGIAVGGLGLTVLFSFAVYRERQRPIQWLGLAVGTVALVFLNL